MKRAVICFTRVPSPGITKTRLLPVLSGEQCAELHWAFLKDLAEVYREMEADLFVACTEDPEWEQLKTVLPMAAGFFFQAGDGLGERMNRAIREVLDRGYDAVVLTGTDLPLLKKEHLESGFAALRDADIAIGPTSDGGYYLIGMKKAYDAVFAGQEYGGANVFENTVRAARAGGLTVGFADCCDDVDTPEDLMRLAEADETAAARQLAGAGQTVPASASHTSRYLAKLRKKGIFQ